jgi:hypothetical protein
MRFNYPPLNNGSSTVGTKKFWYGSEPSSWILPGVIPDFRLPLNHDFGINYVLWIVVEYFNANFKNGLQAVSIVYLDLSREPQKKKT